MSSEFERQATFRTSEAERLASFRFGMSYNDPTGRAHATISAPNSPGTPHSMMAPSHLSPFGADSSTSTLLSSPTSILSAYDTPSFGHRHVSQPALQGPGIGFAPPTPTSAHSRRIATEPYPRPKLVSPRSYSSVSDDEYQGGPDESDASPPKQRSTSASTSGGAGKAPKAVTETRNARLVSERRRRDTVRDYIGDLRNLLPASSGGAPNVKMTKSKILEKAVQLVMTLQAENDDYARRIAILESRNQLLNSVLARGAASGQTIEPINHAEAAMLASMPPPPVQAPCAATMPGHPSLSYLAMPPHHQPQQHYMAAPQHWSFAPPQPRLYTPQPQAPPPQPTGLVGLESDDERDDHMDDVNPDLDHN